MNPTITATASRRKRRALSPVDAEHTRLRALPWPARRLARRLARRHGLRASTARTIAELAFPGCRT